jgi:hypothetical protein
MLPMYSILTFKTIMMLMTIWISTSGDVFIVFFIAIIPFLAPVFQLIKTVLYQYFLFFIFFCILHVDINPMS